MHRAYIELGEAHGIAYPSRWNADGPCWALSGTPGDDCEFVELDPETAIEVDDGGIEVAFSSIDAARAQRG